MYYKPLHVYKYAVEIFGEKDAINKIILADRYHIRKHGRTVSRSIYRDGIPIECIDSQIQLNHDYFSITDYDAFLHIFKLNRKIKINNILDFFEDIRDEFCPIEDYQLKQYRKEMVTEEDDFDNFVYSDKEQMVDTKINLINMMFNLRANKSIDHYNITDKDNNRLIGYYLNNTHIGEPTYNIAYIVEDGYDVIICEEDLENLLQQMYNKQIKIKIDNIEYLAFKYNLVYNKDTDRYDCNQKVHCKDDLIKDGKFIIKFGVIRGDFTCYYLKLTSLENGPIVVNGELWCDHNQLTSLQYCPLIVDGSFYCDNNKLTSLQYCPIEVKGHFNCSHNQLTSLQYSPQIIKGYFDCSYNQLTSLQYCLPKLEGDFCFYCTNNKLTSLDHASKTNYKIICYDNLIN